MELVVVVQIWII